jgi:hypothetical protein
VLAPDGSGQDRGVTPGVSVPEPRVSGAGSARAAASVRKLVRRIPRLVTRANPSPCLAWGRGERSAPRERGQGTYTFARPNQKSGIARSRKPSRANSLKFSAAPADSPAEILRAGGIARRRRNSQTPNRQRRAFLGLWEKSRVPSTDASSRASRTPSCKYPLAVRRCRRWGCCCCFRVAPLWGAPLGLTQPTIGGWL